MFSFFSGDCAAAAISASRPGELYSRPDPAPDDAKYIMYVPIGTPRDDIIIYNHTSVRGVCAGNTVDGVIF